ncbi:hypothetical protein [Streptomyces sp. ST1015]|nr:hypothetical protein [Streptomyces sp. ST1015]
MTALVLPAGLPVLVAGLVACLVALAARGRTANDQDPKGKR